MRLSYGQNSGNPESQLHYLALPFQRPEHVADVTKTESARLEPAGALYLILQPRQDNDTSAEKREEQISTIAAQLQHICTLSCLKASSLVADFRAIAAAASEARLKAYDGIGHALRTFVEATKYNTSIKLLSAVQHDDRLPGDLVKEIARARRNLAFFEHAEALGSLMRLGWLGVQGRGLNKVIECFDEEEVRAIQESRLDSLEVVTAAAGVISALASALAYKDEVVFRIRYRDAQGVQSVLVAPEIEESETIQPEPSLPPLKSDKRAVLLALYIPLLEPLRNASMHIRGHEPASMVEVLLEGRRNGVVVVYVGNRWYGSGGSNVDMLTLSTGIILVQQLLKECHLGGFFNVSPTDLNERTEAPIDPGNSYEGYVWIGVEMNPLALYNFAKRGT